MTRDRDLEPRPAAWIRWVTWTAILAPLPYTLSRVLWALGIPLGIDADVLHDELHAPGLGSLFILLLGVAAELTALWTRAFLLMRASRYPRWLPILRNRPVRRGLVVAPLLVPIVILAVANAMSATWIADGFRRAPDTESSVADWAVSVAAVEFWIWGVSLTVATAAYWLAARRPRSSVLAGHVEDR